MDNKTCKNLLNFLYIKEFVLRLLLDLIGIRTKINIRNARSLQLQLERLYLTQKMGGRDMKMMIRILIM
jgi:hypothetical protein